MAAGGEQRKAVGDCLGGDLYAVLGLKKECSATDLRTAYKKLALRWHPDRCSSLGCSQSMEEAKTKFQAIQEAYSVLSDTNKRFLYDVGVYDGDDDADASGMGEFLGEMAAMMSQAKPNGGGKETFEELQELFMEMFQADMDAFCGGGSSGSGGGCGSGESSSQGENDTATATSASSWARRSTDGYDRPSTSSTSFSTTSATAASSYNNGKASGGGGGGYKRDSADMCSGKAKGVAASDGAAGLRQGGSFCFGVQNGNGSSGATKGRTGNSGGGGGGKRRNGRKPKASSRHSGPSQDNGDTLAE